MNLRRTLLTFLMLAIASVASAQGVKIVKNTINKDSLPSDAIVVKRVPLESGPAFEVKDVLVVDTIPSSSEGLNIVLYNDNTWRFVRNRDIDVLDETVFTKEWDTTKIQPFKAELKDLPMSMVIDLVDSLKSYHYPYKGRVTSKYGPRRRRIHQGTDIDLETGDPVYATFDGRVRICTYVRNGYGNLVVLRHDNGLETFYGHLSEINVKPNEWVTAGQVIGINSSKIASTEYEGMGFAVPTATVKEIVDRFPYWFCEKYQQLMAVTGGISSVKGIMGNVNSVEGIEENNIEIFPNLIALSH